VGNCGHSGDGEIHIPRQIKVKIVLKETAFCKVLCFHGNVKRIGLSNKVDSWEKIVSAFL
jgi:hypothetical protein